MASLRQQQQAPAEPEVARGLQRPAPADNPSQILSSCSSGLNNESARSSGVQVFGTEVSTESFVSLEPVSSEGRKAAPWRLQQGLRQGPAFTGATSSQQFSRIPSSEPAGTGSTKATSAFAKSLEKRKTPFPKRSESPKEVESSGAEYSREEESTSEEEEDEEEEE